MIGYIIFDKRYSSVPMIGIALTFRNGEFIVYDVIPRVGAWGDVYKVEFEPLTPERHYSGFGLGYFTRTYTVLELV